MTCIDTFVAANGRSYKVFDFRGVVVAETVGAATSCVQTLIVASRTFSGSR